MIISLRKELKNLGCNCFYRVATASKYNGGKHVLPVDERLHERRYFVFIYIFSIETAYEHEENTQIYKNAYRCSSFNRSTMFYDQYSKWKLCA